MNKKVMMVLLVMVSSCNAGKISGRIAYTGTKVLCYMAAAANIAKTVTMLTIAGSKPEYRNYAIVLGATQIAFDISLAAVVAETNESMAQSAKKFFKESRLP